MTERSNWVFAGIAESSESFCTFRTILIIALLKGPPKKVPGDSRKLFVGGAEVDAETQSDAICAGKWETRRSPVRHNLSHGDT